MCGSYYTVNMSLLINYKVVYIAFDEQKLEISCVLCFHRTATYGKNVENRRLRMTEVPAELLKSKSTCGLMVENC